MNASVKVIIGVVVLSTLVGGFYLWRNGLVTLPWQWASDRGEEALDSMDEIEGEVGHVSADAGAFVLEDDQGREWSVVVDDFTQTFDEEGSLVAVGEFSKVLVEGENVFVILDSAEEGYGTALLIRIQNDF